MKKLVAFCFLINMAIGTYSQWSGSNPLWTNSNVGIGTQNPYTKTEVAANGVGYWNYNDGWYAQNPPASSLTITNTTLGGYDPVLIFRQSDQGGTIRQAGAIGLVGRSSWLAGNNASQISDMYFAVRNASGGISERMRIVYNGNVGIGTTSPGNYKLNVNGTIRANEIVVNTSGADFVFDPEYHLPDLSEIEKFVRLNKRLPDFPSAKEMQENGMSMSEIQTKLLRKIEELTLYSIEQNKRIESLERQIMKLDKPKRR